MIEATAESVIHIHARKLEIATWEHRTFWLLGTTPLNVFLRCVIHRVVGEFAICVNKLRSL